MVLIGLRGMQDCFRQHPETYASEFEDDEEEVEDELRARDAAAEEVSPTPQSATARSAEPSQKVASEASESKPIEEPHRESSNTTADQVPNSGSKGEEVLPKAAFDARS